MGNIGLHAVSIDDDSIIAIVQSYHPLCVHWTTTMCGFRHNESFIAHVTRDCKGYISIKDETGLLINQRLVLDVSSISSDEDIECM